MALQREVELRNVQKQEIRLIVIIENKVRRFKLTRRRGSLAMRLISKYGKNGV